MPDTQLRTILRANAARFGERTAVTTYEGGDWRTCSWSRFAAAAQRAAERCREALAEPVALVALDSTAGSLATLLGLAMAGIGVVVFEARTAQLRDTGSVLHAVGTGTLIVPDRASPDRTDRYRSLYADELSGLTGTADAVGQPTTGTTAADPPAGGVPVYQATSGSTGEPRLARQSLANLIRGGLLYRDVYDLTPQDTTLCAVPPAHSFGMVAGLYATVAAGGTLALLRQYSARGVGTALDAGATVVLGTPLVYELVRRTIRHRGGPGRYRVRAALSSGGPIAADVAADAAAVLGTPVLQVYGSTETGLIACQRAQPEPWPGGCVGRPAPGVHIRVPAAPGAAPQDPDDGLPLSVRTATMFSGYVGGSGVPVDAEGYYDVGDLGRLDEAGRLHVLGRKTSFINVGGRKVNPVRVQRIVREYPHLLESIVYGVESAGGEEVHAAVSLDGDGSVPALLAFCRERLAHHEVPHAVHVLRELPRTGMGKVDRRRLPTTPEC